MSDRGRIAELPSETVADPDKPLCLGHLGGWFHVLTPHGELRSLRGQDLAAGRGVEEIVAGHEGFVRTRFSREGGGWNSRAFGRWLMDRCAESGLVDLAALEVRGLGTWRDSTGCAVAHCGDVLIYADGRTHRAGNIDGRIVWPAAPASERPAAAPADRDDGRELGEAVRGGWAWAREVDADLWLGWLGCAVLGGFPSWRPGIVVTGPRGSGKSELMQLAETLLGAMARPMLNGATEAGLRQGGNGQARAMLLDEAEPGPDGLPVTAILGFLRRMTGGTGGRVARGGADHRAHHFYSVGAGYLTAILPPPMAPQDRSRIVHLELGPLPATDPVRASKRLAELHQEARDLCPTLWRRALDQSPRWDATVGALASEARRLGADHRDADTAAALVAGRDLLTEDGALTAERLAAARPLIAAIIEASVEADTASEAELCLTHLLGSMAPMPSGRVSSIAELLGLVMYHGGSAQVDEVNALGRVGLRVPVGKDGVQLVSGPHPQLTRLFAGTRWADGGHRAALLSLDGAAVEPNSVRIGGRKVRAIRLPASVIPQDPGDDP